MIIFLAVLETTAIIMLVLVIMVTMIMLIMIFMSHFTVVVTVIIIMVMCFGMALSTLVSEPSWRSTWRGTRIVIS